MHGSVKRKRKGVLSKKIGLALFEGLFSRTGGGVGTQGALEARLLLLSLPRYELSIRYPGTTKLWRNEIPRSAKKAIPSRY